MPGEVYASGARLRRRDIILFASALSLIGAILPIVIALHVSWKLALKEQQERLERFDQRALRRTTFAFAGATEALRMMAETTAAPCSADHIAVMHRLTLNNRFIDEIGYLKEGLLRCTTWGVTRQVITRPEPDFVTASGIGVVKSLHPQVMGGNPRMALFLGDYDVLLDPALFIDVLLDPGIQLAIATERGDLIATRNDPDPTLLKALLADPQSGFDERFLFATLRGDGWIAVAVQPRYGITEAIGRQETLLLPLAIIIAGGIVGLIVWLARKRLSPLGELTVAVRQRAFVNLYQPIIELATGRCVGAEALVRWRQPDGYLAPPSDFMPLAERSGLILAITDQVIERVIADLESVLAMDRSCHVTVNLSADDVRTGRALDVIETKLAATRIERAQIWLEATESGFVEIEAAHDTIQRATQLGYPVAVDDFGTGYSCLSYLQNLPFKALKIDKIFIDTIGRETARSSVTPWIIAMARNLGLVCIAEGIETDRQLNYLRNAGVTYGQGWLFAKPLSAEDFTEFHRSSCLASAEPGMQDQSAVNPPSIRIVSPQTRSDAGEAR